MLESWTHGGSLFSVGHLGYCFYLSTDDRLALGQLEAWGAYSTNVIRDTDWHHVAVSRSGTNVTFYLDGVQDATSAITNVTFRFDSAAAIGTRGDWVGGTF